MYYNVNTIFAHQAKLNISMKVAKIQGRGKIKKDIFTGNQKREDYTFKNAGVIRTFIQSNLSRFS